MLWLHVTKCIPDSFALQLRSILLLFTMDIGGYFVLFCFVSSYSYNVSSLLLLLLLSLSLTRKLAAILSFRFSLQITCSPLIHTQRAHTHTYTLAAILRARSIFALSPSLENKSKPRIVYLIRNLLATSFSRRCSSLRWL